jgi:hypothetical protein
MGHKDKFILLVFALLVLVLLVSVERSFENKNATFMREINRLIFDYD